MIFSKSVSFRKLLKKSRLHSLVGSYRVPCCVRCVAVYAALRVPRSSFTALFYDQATRVDHIFMVIYLLPLSLIGWDIVQY